MSQSAALLEVQKIFFAGHLKYLLFLSEATLPRGVLQYLREFCETVNEFNFGISVSSCLGVIASVATQRNYPFLSLRD